MTDPAGLDAAIGAAYDAYRQCYGRWTDEEEVDTIVRAATPHIRRAALLDAADEAMEAELIGGWQWAGWLRERAERETT